MPLRSQHTFGGRGLYIKKKIGSPRPKTASQKALKEKRGKDSCHKKQKNDTLCSLSEPSNTIPNVTTVGLDLVL